MSVWFLGWTSASEHWSRKSSYGEGYKMEKHIYYFRKLECFKYRKCVMNNFVGYMWLTTRVCSWTILFLLFINDISQYTAVGCLTNLYADDAMIYAPGDNILEVQQKLQQCVKI